MHKNPKDDARGEWASLSESVTHSMTKSKMPSETFHSYVQLSARPTLALSQLFFFKRLLRFNKLCTILCIVFRQSFHAAHSPSAGCLQWLPASPGGWWYWQKALQWDRKFYVSLRKVHSMASSCFCSHTASQHHFFSTNSFWLIAKGGR